MSYDLRLIDKPHVRSYSEEKQMLRPLHGYTEDANRRRRSRGFSGRINAREAPDLSGRFLDPRETSDRELCKRSELFSSYACLHDMHNNSSGCLLAITGVLCTYRERILLYIAKYLKVLSNTDYVFFSSSV